VTRKGKRSKNNDIPAVRHLREFRTAKADNYKVGQQLTVEQFEIGDKVDVVGKTKGRGFAGVVKRHGFAGGVKTHGQSDRWRAPGFHRLGDRDVPRAERARRCPVVWAMSARPPRTWRSCASIRSASDRHQRCGSRGERRPGHYQGRGQGLIGRDEDGTSGLQHGWPAGQHL
jgi:hypothetical protein